MKLALISDIHGNHVALEAILARVRASGVDGIAFMGDYASDFSGTRRVFDMLYDIRRDMPTWFVRGNRDDYLLDHRRGKNLFLPDSSRSGALFYAYNELTGADLDFLENLPISAKVTPELTVCHATPMSNKDKNAYYSRDYARKCLNLAGTRYLVCGHMHTVRTWNFPEGQTHVISSAGLPAGAPGMTRFAYFSDNPSSPGIEHVTIAYDARRAVNEMKSSGLMEMSRWWGKAVAVNALTGRNATYDLVITVDRLLKEEGKSGPASEDCYARAAQIIGLDYNP